MTRARCATLLAWLALAAGCESSAMPGDASISTSDVPTDVVADSAQDAPRTADDADHDTICDAREGSGDADGDGIPNYLDTDSDGDGRGDALEAVPVGTYDCRDAPADSDHDGTPDFLDTDSDDNGIPDARDFVGTGAAPTRGWAIEPSDWDRDSVPDYADPDDDNDRISDATEIGDDAKGRGPGNPADTDRDGTPDYRDLDADADTVADADETERDRDGDTIGNWRDLDADGDTIDDAIEAGDAMISTPPVECTRELDAETLMGVHPDGIPDFLDTDSDNDGLLDNEEQREGTDRCNADTDGDGLLDSAEVRWCYLHGLMRCALDPSTVIPFTDVYVLLRNNGPVISREVEFDTDMLAPGSRADLTVSVRNEPMNRFMVDATRFVLGRTPSCQVPPLNTACWTEPTGVAHADAVSRTDASTMFGVLAGTHVRWTLRLQNTGVYPGSESGVALFTAHLDLVAGTDVITTRDVFVMVPYTLL